MASRLIVNEQAGMLSFNLALSPDQVSEIAASGQPFESPFEGDELQDLRWYLEDYLKAPYAVWEDRGSGIEAKLEGWGRALFDALFGLGKPGRDAYRQLDGGNDWELWLAIPPSSACRSS